MTPQALELPIPTPVDELKKDYTYSATSEVVVLNIAEMPRGLRPVVESLMVDYLNTPSDLSLPGADPLHDDGWFTAWQRDPKGLRCRQILAAPAEELHSFSHELDKLSNLHHFQAVLEQA